MTTSIKYIVIWLTFLCIVAPNLIKAQSYKTDKVIYKTVNDSIDLYLHFIHPQNYYGKDKWPTIIFFHGGGWNRGSYKQFLPQAKHFSGLDFNCVLVEYRVHNKHKSTPFESLMDAKSAVRFLKENAERYKVDLTQMIAVGGSAGGHLAAAVELVSGYNDSRDNLEISTSVDALILFNPVLDNSPNGYGYSRIGEDYLTFSPFYQLKKEIAPTLIMLGTEDQIVSPNSMKRFCSDMEAVNSECKLILYEGQSHGFFNNGVYYEKTIKEVEIFLWKKEFLKMN